MKNAIETSSNKARQFAPSVVLSCQVALFTTRWTLLISTLAALSGRTQDFEPLPDGEPPPRVELHLSVPARAQVPLCTGALGGVQVRYPAPFVVSDCQRPSTVTCEPPSGTLFPPGETMVNCVGVTECGERTTASFPVSLVQDQSPPRLDCPRDVVAYSTDGRPVLVDYAFPAASDDADLGLRTECSPASGSLFPIGATNVVCVATDSCSNVSTCSFVVQVRASELRIRPVQSVAGRDAIDVTSVGLEGLDYCDAIGDEWHPAEGPQVRQFVGDDPTRFYRPPWLEGVIRVPQAEIAYVSVGLLRAYANPGVDMLRNVDDSVTSGGVTLLPGDYEGSGNRWSQVWQLPFTFRFYGRPYKKFRVSKNGLLTFSTNIVTGLEGLDYFNFSQGADVMTNCLPLWSAGFNIDNTIFCMAGRHVPQNATHDVTIFTYGQAPKRQAWILFRHPKDVYGLTHTAIVLEEGSNRIYLMDMDVTNTSNTFSRLLAGIQGQSGSTREFRQVPASPWMGLVASDNARLDNGCYLFRPYVLGGQVSGDASPQLMAVTNLDLLITERMRMTNLPGCTVAVSRDGKMIFNKAYGFANVEKNIKMKPYHRACIGSVSKVLAALGIEKLIEQGSIQNLDTWAYASNLLGRSWFWSGVNQGVTNSVHANFGVATTLNVISNITLRHLLSHMSGLNNNNDDLGAAKAYAGGSYSNLTAQQQVRWFMASQPLFTNGVAIARQYSNPSFKQLGVLVELLAGQPFENWMNQTLLEPAGVSNMRLLRTWESQETWRDARRYYFYSTNLPWGRNRFTDVLGPIPYDNFRYDNAADGGAGSWTATAADLCRLMAACDGIPNHPDIIDPARVNELETVAFPNVSSMQAHGWDTSSPIRVSKGGSIGFGSCILTRTRGPERLTVAVVCNTSVGATRVATDVYSAVAAVGPVEEFYDLFYVIPYLPLDVVNP